MAALHITLGVYLFGAGLFAGVLLCGLDGTREGWRPWAVSAACVFLWPLAIPASRLPCWRRVQEWAVPARH